MQETILCNLCGKPFDIFDRQQDFTIHKRVGYGSVHDGSLIDLHLCCDCFDKIIDKCALSPVTEEGGFFY